MNERIEELARQCYVKTGSTHTDHFEYWKFAELIVQECAAYMYKHFPHSYYEVNYMRKHMGDKNWNKSLGDEE